MGSEHRPVLVVEHQPSCPVGWVGDWLTDAGARLEVVRPYAVPTGASPGASPGAPPGERAGALPGDPTAYAGIVVLGGAMGAHDDADCPWLPDVRALIRAAAAARVPTLGICLGHQLAAVALGGAIGRNPRGRSLGLIEIRWTAEGAADPLTGQAAVRSDPVAGESVSAAGRSGSAAGRAESAAGRSGGEDSGRGRNCGQPPLGVHWNDDIVTSLPSGTVVLARAATGEVQAARFAPTVWGVQWHPEVGPQIAADWMREDEGAPELEGVDVGAHVAAIAAAQGHLQTAWGDLTRRFATLCRLDGA